MSEYQGTKPGAVTAGTVTTQPREQADEDQFIIEAVERAKIHCVHPTANTTRDIGRAVLAAYRAAQQAAPEAPVKQSVDAHTTSYAQGYRAGIEIGKAMADDATPAATTASASQEQAAAQLDADNLPPLTAHRGVVGSIGDYTGFCSLLDGYGQALVECETAGYYRETIARKDAALAALIAYIDGRTAGTASEAEVEYELYEAVDDDRLMVAGTSGKGAYEEILRYAAQYAQDGPVEICKVVRTKLSVPAAAPSTQEGAK